MNILDTIVAQKKVEVAQLPARRIAGIKFFHRQPAAQRRALWP
jgi:hypothetical protein